MELITLHFNQNNFRFLIKSIIELRSQQPALCMYVKVVFSESFRRRISPEHVQPFNGDFGLLCGNICVLCCVCAPFKHLHTTIAAESAIGSFSALKKKNCVSGR